MNKHHFLVISLPAQGHLNPTLQLARNIALAGSRATFTTTVFGLRQLNIDAHPSIDGLSYASISDGHDDDNTGTRKPGYLAALKVVGSKNLTKLLEKFSAEGRPITFLVYTILLPWVAVVARENHIPSAFLAIQSATTFAIYHHFFNRNNGIHTSNKTYDPSISIELPGLPSLTCNDIPSFLLPDNPYSSVMINILQEHIQTLEEDPNPCVLANTFDALEENSISYIVPNYRFIPIGPLISFDSKPCDLFESSETDYISWLDSKPNKSVIYVSFGSLAVLQKRQKDELYEGLVQSGRPFLWVLRDHGKTEETEDFKEKSEHGLIVSWCSQLEVLRHRAIGCFVTHCGWNSVVESVVSGVAMVGCPQFSDQMTNAKMLEVLGIGVRAGGDREGVVVKEEIERCLEIVMGEGEKGEGVRNNVEKWKGLALEALEEGGSSCRNFSQFLATPTILN